MFKVRKKIKKPKRDTRLVQIKQIDISSQSPTKPNSLDGTQSIVCKLIAHNLAYVENSSLIEGLLNTVDEKKQQFEYDRCSGIGIEEPDLLLISRVSNTHLSMSYTLEKSLQIKNNFFNFDKLSTCTGK
jgi:hypothetical protein